MSASNPIRVILIDDHRRIHQVISEILGFADDIKLVAQGSNGQEAIHLCDEYQPDLVLMDVMMPGMDGIEATRRILEKHPNIKILALSSFQDQDSVRAMLDSGACGYVLKDGSIDDLDTTIRTTYEGKAVFSTEVTQVLMQSPDQDSQRDYDLSEREREVLKLMAEGLNNGEIAAQLTISQSTVKFHISNIISKMGVETRAEAMVLAAKNNLV